MFHSLATGRRREQTLPEALSLRQALHPRDDTAGSAAHSPRIAFRVTPEVRERVPAACLWVVSPSASAVTIADAGGGSLPPPGYPGDHPCPTKGAAIQSHNDEDQSMLQRRTVAARQERYGQAELH